MKRPHLAAELDARHRRLAAGVVEIELERRQQLLAADDRAESGLEELAGVLYSARRLPETLVVRLAVREPGTSDGPTDADIRAACAVQAALAWREAIGMRRNGLRDLPLAVLFAALFGVAATGAATVAESTSPDLLAGLLYVLAGIGVIAAWASAWLPIQQVLFDWRAPAHRARAYDLLARARLELISTGEEETPRGEGRPAAGPSALASV